jgi:hypothetical protein
MDPKLAQAAMIFLQRAQISFTEAPVAMAVAQQLQVYAGGGDAGAAVVAAQGRSAPSPREPITADPPGASPEQPAPAAPAAPAAPVGTQAPEPLAGSVAFLKSRGSYL